MALFQLKWLRNFVRRNTKPVPHGQAHAWKKRLSIGYAILAWNAFGFVLYAVFTGKEDWAKSAGLKSEVEAAMSPAQSFSKLFKMEKAKVIRVSGVSNYTEYEINNTLDENDDDEAAAKTNK